MLFVSTRQGDQSPLARWVVIVLALARIPPTLSEGIDCREVSGYSSGQIPDTCALQLPLNDTQAEINSSIADCHHFPHKCRPREYTVVHLLLLYKKKIIFEILFFFGDCLCRAVCRWLWPNLLSVTMYYVNCSHMSKMCHLWQFKHYLRVFIYVFIVFVLVLVCCH